MVMNVQDRGVLPEEMRYTYSVCPVCLKRIPAKREERDGQIYLVKTCPEHGTFSSVIWRNKRKFADWRGERPAVGENENLNCPAGCGLCAEHRRATCCTLLEITARCNMNCTFCFAEPDGTQDPSLDTVKRWINDLTEPGKTLLQLSGGEPTVRDDLPEIVAYAKQVGCKYVQLNSNGLRLAEDEAFVKRLADAGLSFVFMQFDGVDDAVYEKLRRRPMLEVKKRAIEQCGRYGIGVTLVPVFVSIMKKCRKGWNLKPFRHFLCLRSSFQHNHVFHVLRMREHVHGAYSHDFVLRIQQSQVTCLCGRIATDVDDAMRCGK